MLTKIHIDIKHDWKFELVASLVDREDFLQDIEESRGLFGLKILLTYEGADKLSKAIDDMVRGVGNPIIDLGQFRLLQSLEAKYDRGYDFSRVIRYSLLCGLVTESEFPSVCHFMLIDSAPSFFTSERAIRLYSGYNNQEVIVLHPEAKIKDVKIAFKDYQKYLKEHKPALDTKSSIRRDREWYWMWKEEMVSGRGAYSRVLNKWNQRHQDEENNTGYINDINIIEQAVCRYRKLLKR